MPIWSDVPAPGAHGSLWQTELTILNAGPGGASIHGYDWGCRIPTCPPAPLTPPGIAFRPRLQAVSMEVPGVFLVVEASHAPTVAIGLRVRDLSRQLDTWGTEIPIVRERDFRSGNTDLLDIPVKPGFRQMLRVYDLDPTRGPATARIRVYGMTPRSTPFEQGSSPDPLLIDEVHAFQYATSGDLASHPGYIAVADFGQRPEVTPFEQIRVQIEMLTADHRYWAFVAVTNNATQHVTTITP